MAVSPPSDPQPPQSPGEARPAHAVAGTRWNNVSGFDHCSEERFLEAALDPAEVGRDDPAGTGALHRKPNREGDRHAHRLGQRVERRAVCPRVRGHNLDFVPAGSHIEHAAQNPSQLVADGRGREELDAVGNSLGRYLRPTPLHRMEKTAVGLGCYDVPQDTLGDFQAFHGVGPEDDGAEPSQLAQEAPLETAPNEAGQEEDPGICRQRVLFIPLQHLNGCLEHPRRVRAVPFPQQRLVPRQDLCHQRSLVESALGAAAAPVNVWMDPSTAQRRHRIANRVPEAGLFCEFPEE